DSYDMCLSALRNFRDKHIQIVSRYIIIPARDAHKHQGVTSGPGKQASRPLQEIKSTNAVKSAKGLATVDTAKKGFRGTGGTALIPFLKQARDETTEKAIGEWAKRAGTPRRNSEDGKENVNKEKDEFTCGLAGMWLSTGEMGGLCSF